ncbi:hypothetical protein JTE90_014924 [Oedothorax gibbosus]|uniref:TACO1/YebC-like second and third domain-containing protein n=1 Tax=Oedothorax gibbosus TaxID=931172 RepID=A0AAV6VKV3_9ARAC|nr:hypothetical protein JTE90_014924 [Oedothorax gibbosus]
MCNATFSRNLTTLLFKNPSPKLFNVSANPPQVIREISQRPKESASLNHADITHTLVTFKYLRLIKRAIREFGPVVEENKKLESLLSRANKLGISQESIEFARKTSVDVRVNTGFLELFLFYNCHFIIQYEDFDLSRTKPYIMRLCERSDTFMGHGNLKWQQSFEQKAIILVKNESSSPLRNFSKAEAIASKAGAQSVKKEIDVEGIEYLQFLSDSSDLHKVKRHLDQEGCDIEEAFVGYIPKHKVTLPTHHRNAACKIINELNCQE